jgi:hypothetical protein
VIPFQEARERLPVAAASLLVKLAADLLKWQDPVSATVELLRFTAVGIRRIFFTHRAPLPTR